MINVLYIDKEFKNSIGGDKNRSKYLYETLEQNSYLYTCIIRDKTDKRMYADIDIHTLSRKKGLLPQSIANFSQESLGKVLDFVIEKDIKTVFFRTIAFSKIASYIKLKLPQVKILIDADLILSRLMQQAWKKNKSFKSRYYLIESLKLSLYERSLYKQDFTFLFSNETESLDIKEQFPHTDVEYLANTTKLKITKPIHRDSNVILYYGTMSSTANIDAYNFICDELYSKIEKDLEKYNYEIHIVGKDCKNLISSKHKRIKIIGKVDSIENVLMQSSFVLLPLFIASGTNTRVIEAVMAGCPVLTTSLGIEGLLQYDESYTGDTAREIGNNISQMLQDKNYRMKIAKTLQTQIIHQFSYTHFQDKLIRILSKSTKEKISLVHVPRRFTQKSWGGTETVVINSANNLNALGYESEIYTSKALDKQSTERLDSVLVKRFKYFYPFFGLSKKQKESFDAIGGNLFSFSLLFALLGKKDIGIIHLHTLKRMGGIVRTVAKWKKVPYVITLHGGYFNIDSGEEQHRNEQLKNGLEWGKILGFIFGSRKVLDDAAAIITLSQEEYAATYKRYGDKAHYISNGVDLEKFSTKGEGSFKKTYNILSDTKMLLCSARIDPQKNQLLLLEVFNSLNSCYDNLHLVFLGAVSDPNYYQKMYEFIKINSLESKITFVHHLTPKDQLLVDAYTQADLLVLPSRHEPFGMVVLEAWSAGTPVVASRTGGIEKIITHNHNGLLFKNGNKEQLYTNIEKVLQSKSLETKLIKQASKDVLKYDWKNIANNLDSIYKNILKAA